MTLLYDPFFWVLAIIGLLLTGVSKSGFAGGAGVVAVPLLSLVIPVQQAIALVLPLLLVMDAKNMKLYWQDVKFQDIKTILLAAIVGISLAGFGINSLPTETLQIILAIFCVLFACWKNLTALLGKLPGAAYLWGTLSGITSTLLHAGGPPINIYFLSKGLAKRQWLAQAALFFALMNLIKLIPYTLSGLWQKELMLIDLFLLPVAWLGVKLGYWVQTQLSEKYFMGACRVLLFGSGIGLVTKALL